MTVQDIRKCIKSNSVSDLPRIILMYGEESSVIDIYINDILKMFQYKFVCSTVKEVIDRLGETSLFSSETEKRIYVVRYDCDFMKKPEDLSDIINLLESSDSYIILKYTEIDKKSSVFNDFGEYILEFPRMTESVIAKHICEKVDMDKRYAEHLATTCGCDYGTVLLELNKVVNFANATGCSIDEAYKKLYTSGSIYDRYEESIFNICDYILCSDPQDAFSGILSLRKMSDSVLGAVSIFHGMLKNALQVKCYSGNDIYRDTGLNRFQISNAKKHAEMYTAKQIISLMKCLLSIESGIKKGLIDNDIAFDYMFVKMFGGDTLG